MFARSKKVLSVLFLALFLTSSLFVAVPEASARTTCAPGISTSLGSGRLFSSICPITISCCSVGILNFQIFSCQICECGYLLTGGGGSHYTPLSLPFR